MDPAGDTASPGTPPEAPPADAPVLVVTDTARTVVLDARSQEPDADRLGLWVEVTGASGDVFTYDMYFQMATDAAGGDLVTDQVGLLVVVPAGSVAALRGARLDWSDDGDGGLVIVNPNLPPRPVTADLPPSDLTSDLALRILRVLDEQINPSIAAHGGRADLVTVDEGIAYLRLGGGCQGCGLATVTLSQGIEVALRDEIPELVGVVDVTDHAGGLNPYFESAKK